ncbi:MAG: hypothetical protein RLZZ618_1878 [Pseudomonadota bacterium]|jgi:type IV pilus assembly protein PilX
MKTRRHIPSSRPARTQRGAVLIIALIMLVLVTMVSLTVIRSATLEEKMAGNARDRDKAFQATEAALRICLARLMDDSYVGANPTAQDPAPTGSEPVWAATSANWTNNAIAIPMTEIDTSAYGIAASPRCIFERLGVGTGSYRVTARGVGVQSTSPVILQATYTAE